tara:strand:- start:70 stop:822 length:753 start_codon:yes stop_codon:yes gene_type:complete
MDTTTIEIPDAIATLDGMNVEVDKLAQPLLERLTARGKATKSELSWNETVLGLVAWAVESEESIGDLYDLISEVLTARVVRLGKDKGLDDEALKRIEKLSANTISQLNGQLYAVACTLELDGVEGIQETIEEEGSTWGSLKKYTAGRVESFAFANSRHGVNVSYTPQGSDHAVTFTVGKASDSRNKHAKAVKVAETLKAENGPHWSAVLRQFRSENPAGMIDRRNKSDDLALGQAIRRKLDPMQIADLLK